MTSLPVWNTPELTVLRGATAAEFVSDDLGQRQLLRQWEAVAIGRDLRKVREVEATLRGVVRAGRGGDPDQRRQLAAIKTLVKLLSVRRRELDGEVMDMGNGNILHQGRLSHGRGDDADLSFECPDLNGLYPSLI